MNRKLLAGACLAIMVTAAAAGYAFAITSNTFTYSPAKTGALMIDSMDLTSDGAGGGFSVDYPSGILSVRGGDALRCLQTGVRLPQGAEIIELRLAYKSAWTYDPVVWLVRHAPFSGPNVELVHATIAGPPNPNRQIAVFDLASHPGRFVNNATFSYGFAICISGGDVFHGARIGYTFTSAGD